MSKCARTARQPKPGPDWSVRDVSRRRDWSDEVGACAYCGTPVDMRGEHYGMELIRESPGSDDSTSTTALKRTFEYERYVFCDAACLEEWRAEE